MNSEFSYISSTFKKTDSRDESIKEMLRKPKGNKPTFSVNKKKKRLILDLRYLSSHVYKDIIKFDDWRYFQNFLECNVTCLNSI